MLTTCVLYTCFEALQGHCDQAIIHATQGYNLLQQYAMNAEKSRWDVGAFALELDQLSLLIRRLQTSKSLMDRHCRTSSNLRAIRQTLPSMFHSLQEAQSTLEQVLSHLTTFFLDMELDDEYYRQAAADEERHSIFGLWLDDWEKAFSDLLSRSHEAMSEEDRITAMTLKAHHIVAEILASVDLSLNELGWDAFRKKFSAIVDLATSISEKCGPSQPSKIEKRWNTDPESVCAPKATLSLSLGIVDPLFEVCARCREPALRQRALDLLVNHPRQDCVWSSSSIWKVGTLLMRQKEESERNPLETAMKATAAQRNSESWLSSLDQLLEPRPPRYSTPTMSIPRTSARYALNPGLYEERELRHESPRQESNMISRQNSKMTTTSSLTPESRVTTMSSLTPESSMAETVTMSEVYDTPDWIDYDGFHQRGVIPAIVETPPED